MSAEVFSSPVVSRGLKRPKSEPRTTVRLEEHRQPKRRTMTDFNTFCTWVLDYEASLQQEQMEFVPKRSTSPLDSEGNSIMSGESDASSKSFKHLELEKGEDWDCITCFCNKPFSGRPMIECSECSTWIHLSCAKIRKSNVPDIFVCAQCRDSKQDIRRSSRQREPKKQFKELYEEL